MCGQDKEDNPKGKASRVETVLYINGGKIYRSRSNRLLW